MSKKYSFPEPGCYSCEHLKTMGKGIGETRYCGGFPRKRMKRFRAADPQIKAPSWCPRRLKPRALRVYGFLDERSRWMEQDRLPGPGQRAPDYLNPSAFHYRLRLETSTALTANQFYRQYARGGDILSLLEDLEVGEVIEIDDGLQPYYFCYYYSCTLVPVSYFSKSFIRERGTAEKQEGETGI